MRGLILAAALAALPLTALAADPVPAPAPPPGEETLALAQQIVEATGAAKAFGARIHALMEPAMRAALANTPPGQQKQGRLMLDLMERTMEADKPLFLDAAAKAYAQTYSPDELRGLLAFYKTPLGQAMIAKQGALATNLGQATAPLVPKVTRDMLAQLCSQTTCPPEVKKRIDAMTGI